MSEGYGSASDVWQALKANPELAVFDDLVAPRRASFNFGEVVPDSQLEGFYIEDGTFKPTPIQARDPISGSVRDLTVIAVLKDVVPNYMIGVITSQRFVADALPDQATPIAHLLRLKPGVDARVVSEGLELAFLANGLEAVVLREELTTDIYAQVLPGMGREAARLLERVMVPRARASCLVTSSPFSCAGRPGLRLLRRD